MAPACRLVPSGGFNGIDTVESVRRLAKGERSVIFWASCRRYLQEIFH
jgi:hypothetical protein